MKKFSTLIILILLVNQISAQCWKELRGGIYHAGGIKANGTLWMWGGNLYGQLGNGGGNGDEPEPIQVGFDNDWKQLSLCPNYNSAEGSNQTHCAALKEDGTLWMWGSNRKGQLGNNDTVPVNVPIQIGVDTNWIDVQVGPMHTLGLKSDGTMWAWGHNYYGQLGDSTLTDTLVPAQIGTDTNWNRIATGSEHCLALKTDGTLWSWGRNNYYQLGFFNDNQTKKQPTQIGSDTNWVSISVGEDFSLAMKNDSTIWSWGRNGRGQLGVGDNSSYHPVPEKVNDQHKWLYVDAGYAHTLAIRADSTVWGWGYNYNGQIGQNHNDFYVFDASQVGVVDDVLFLDAGRDDNFCISANDTAYGWGSNGYSHLGLGHYSGVNWPVDLPCPNPMNLPLSYDGATTDFVVVHDTPTETTIDSVYLEPDTTGKSATQLYKVYYKNQQALDFTYVGDLRQDSLFTKAWYKSVNDTIEYLIMDLNLTVGDTFFVNEGGVMQVATIITKELEDNRKVLTLDYIYGGGSLTNNLQFIEGIGPNASFFYQSDDKNVPIDYQNGFLTCSKFIDANQVYGYYQSGEVCKTNLTVAIDEANKSNSFTAYPNPTTGIVNFDKNYQLLEVYNLLGTKLLSISNKQQLDISSYPIGIYFIKVLDDEVEEMVKVVKR